MDIRKNNQTATFQKGFVDSPDFDFHNTLCPINLNTEWNLDDLKNFYTSTEHDVQNTDEWNLDDLMNFYTSTEHDVQNTDEWNLDDLMNFYTSTEHDVQNTDEWNLDDLLNFYTSTEHDVQNTLHCDGMFSYSPYWESGYKENEETGTEHAMRDTLPILSGGLFSDSSTACWESGHKEINQKKKRESGYMENEEINPKKKRRRRLELAGDGEGSCKRCMCKKSKCLMLNCGCFAAGVYCEGPCDCINCFNKLIHNDTVLAARKQIESRKSLALAPKPIRWSDSFRLHKRGCSCKKGCHMKYCACYQGGVGCSSSYCRCEGCKNKFNTSSGLTTNPSSSVASVFKFDSLAAPTTTTTTSSSVLADKDQSFGGSLHCNVAAASPTFGFGSAVAPDYYLQSSSLLANPTKPLLSDFQQMASTTPSAFGFVGQENQFPTPFHLGSQIQY